MQKTANESLLSFNGLSKAAKMTWHGGLNDEQTTEYQEFLKQNPAKIPEENPTSDENSSTQWLKIAGIALAFIALFAILIGFHVLTGGMAALILAPIAIFLGALFMRYRQSKQNVELAEKNVIKYYENTQVELETSTTTASASAVKELKALMKNYVDATKTMEQSPALLQNIKDVNKAIEEFAANKEDSGANVTKAFNSLLQTIEAAKPKAVEVKTGETKEAAEKSRKETVETLRERIDRSQDQLRVFAKTIKSAKPHDGLSTISNKTQEGYSKLQNILVAAKNTHGNIAAISIG